MQITVQRSNLILFNKLNAGSFSLEILFTQTELPSSLHFTIFVPALPLLFTIFVPYSVQKPQEGFHKILPVFWSSSQLQNRHQRSESTSRQPGSFAPAPLKVRRSLLLALPLLNLGYPDKWLCWLEFQ